MGESGQLIAAQSNVQLGARDAEPGGSLGFVTGAVRERLRDHVTLDGAQVGAQALRCSDIFASMTKAAFEVGKGMRDVLTLSEAGGSAAPRSGGAALRAGGPRSERSRAGEVQCPPRPEITVPGRGFSLTMSAWQPGMQICVKIVNVFDGNLARGLPNHLAIINLFDPETGAVTCVMDATYITGIRTAAAAVLSHKLLSRPESRIATIVGAGVQAREHLRLLPLVRDFDEIQICSLEFEHAERLARLHPKARAVRDAPIGSPTLGCWCSWPRTAAAPVIEADWVQGGTHLSSVGYHPPAGELPRTLARDRRIFVETSGRVRTTTGRMCRATRRRLRAWNSAWRGNQR